MEPQKLNYLDYVPGLLVGIVIGSFCFWLTIKIAQTYMH